MASATYLLPQRITLKPAEFEDAEYRDPLFNQLITVLRHPPQSQDLETQRDKR
jgi:hypothetical protein